MRSRLLFSAAALALLGAVTISTASAQTDGAQNSGQQNMQNTGQNGGPNTGQQGAQNPGGQRGDTQPAGSEPPHGNAGPTGDTTAQGPIGAGPETMPAKFDENVAARDRIGIMARPLPLSDEQKRQIYTSVMNNAQTPTAQTTAAPATILPPSVELSELAPGLEDQIPVVRGYKSVKLQDKVLLVTPASRVVVGEITK